MRTIQITIDERLINTVDREVKRQGATRSEFIRDALRKYLDYFKTKEKEQKQIEGYTKKPVSSGEFDEWEREQAWIE